MKICFVYDRVNKIGGAERVLAALHEIWPDAPLYTAVFDPNNAPWSKFFQVIPSLINRLPFIKNHHELFPTLMPYAFESFDLSKYDFIISITSAEAKGVLTGPHQLHICYLLTPTRYLWSHYNDYSGKGIAKKIRMPFMNSLKRWDVCASARPDKIISISNFVADRCQKYYHRKSDAIIYPPVDLKRFTRTHQAPINRDHFLIVSRLVPYKRIDIAIKACNELGANLSVVGTGSELKNLKKIAGPTITFLGQVTDSELIKIYQQATAFIFPQEEEFGIAAVEALAAGIPVVGYNGGAAKEFIKPGINGMLFDHQTVADLKNTLSLLKNHTWYDKTIQDSVKQFDTKVFQHQFKQYVEETWQK